MVEIGSLIEQEAVGKTEKEKRRTQMVEKARRDEEREQAEDGPEDIHSVARPRLHPEKSIIFEQELRFDPVTRDPAVMEIAGNLPHHQKPQRDAEENEAGVVNRCERASLQSGQERWFTPHRIETALKLGFGKR